MVEGISTPGDMKKTGNAWRTVSIIAIALLLLVTGFMLWLVFRPETNAGQGVSDQIKQAQATATFPLYAPKTLPPDFEMVEGSVTSQESFVNFSLRHKKEKQLVVTQQQRPPLMEEVNKVRKFRTALGDAYIAELNGRNTGFIATSKTLIIISSADKVDVEILEQLMQRMGTL